ncbi:helix-turn-helix domain-containing protein [Paenibacillus polymyxa]|uniref:helix-turn-helix domain-containing protein n=1 Tax=Paenibacillus polymyxa TaxID=1406 RepID=UPI0025B69728|nr:helix-turn-helix domain-containing protein [Paenibacillus polymyxa]MDN4089439.1 helix-turn-helix domain-containing protein [Paenibacillus polymyxa]
MQFATEMLTIFQASEFLGLKADTLRHLIKLKKIPPVKKGSGIKNSILISKDTLIQFRDNNELLFDYYHLGAPKGYLSPRMIAARFNIKVSLAGLWIRQRRFKDVEIITGLPCGNLTIVPLHSIIEYENTVKQLKDSYVGVEQAQKMLGVAKDLILRWIRQKKIQEVITWYGMRYISLNELTPLQQELEREREMITLPQAVKMLEIPYEIVSDISSEYRIPSMIGNIHLLSKLDFEKMKIEHADLIAYHKSGIPKDFFGTKMLAERFKVQQTDIVRWIKQDRFKGVQKIGATSTASSFYIIPKDSVYEYENFVNNLNENFIDIGKAMKELNISESTMNNWISQNKIKGSIFWLNKWYVPKSTIMTIAAKMDRPKNSINISQAIQEFQISRDQVTALIKTGDVPFTTIKGKEKLINRNDLSNALKRKANRISQLTAKSQYNKLPRIPEGFLTIRNFSKLVNARRSTIEQLIQNDEIKDVKRNTIHGRDYILIPKSAAEEFLKKSGSSEKVFTTKQAAAYLKISHYNTVTELVKKRYFPNAFIENKQYLIPQSDLDEYIKLKALSILPKRKSTPKQNKEEIIEKLSKHNLIPEILDKINRFPTPNYLLQTKKLYKSYTELRIASVGGRPKNIKAECRKILVVYEMIISKLPKDCLDLSEEEIRNILQDESLPISHRTFANRFFHYSFQTIGIKRENLFVITPKGKNSKDKDIYEPEIYLEYVHYVKKIPLHTQEAIKSQYYSNMWLFTLMHLMDAWRPSDIVNELPTLDLDELGIHHLEWFISNELSVEQAQQVINQVYIKTRHSSASKTKALLTFLVPLDMILAAGTAFLINELHRRENQDSFLMQTLLTNALNAKSPTYRHLAFFKFNEKLKGFKSIIMIRSTMTYLFNSIIDSAPDPELALSYTMSLRSHEREESTAVYVQSTNRDGSTNRVSVNLLNRGHFGWLFNFMVKHILTTQELHPTIEERTMLISSIRQDLTPIQLENWAAFIRKNNESRETLTTKLLSFSHNELIDIFRRILRGECTSKDAQGQCFTFPICDKAHLQSCFYCENFIPQLYLLFQLKHEIIRLYKSIKKTDHLTVLLRDSNFLKKLLTILNEAVSFYGESYVNSFIDLHEVRNNVFEIKDRLFAEK